MPAHASEERSKVSGIICIFLRRSLERSLAGLGTKIVGLLAIVQNSGRPRLVDVHAAYRIFSHAMTSEHRFLHTILSNDNVR
jgi:hypothetical protein